MGRGGTWRLPEAEPEDGEAGQGVARVLTAHGQAVDRGEMCSRGRAQTAWSGHGRGAGDRGHIQEPSPLHVHHAPQGHEVEVAQHRDAQ